MTREQFNSLREVESVPRGYQVWPIGRKHGEDYSPDYLIVGKFNKEGHAIDFVKIKTNRAGDIYDGVTFGYTLEELTKYIEGRKRIKKVNLEWYYSQVPKMKIALEAMKTINWD